MKALIDTHTFLWFIDDHPNLRGYSKSHFTPGFSWAKKGFPNKLLVPLHAP